MIMRVFIYAFCMVSLSSCGWLNRVPGMNRSPRIVVSQNEMLLPDSAMAFAPMTQENTPH